MLSFPRSPRYNSCTVHETIVYLIYDETIEYHLRKALLIRMNTRTLTFKVQGVLGTLTNCFYLMRPLYKTNKLLRPFTATLSQPQIDSTIQHPRQALSSYEISVIFLL